MKMQTACFTGHREISSDKFPRLIQRLDKTIAELIAQGVVFYGAGGALGFDTLAAQAVLRAREQNPVVKLIMVLPCHNQDEWWQEADRHEYQRLLQEADKISCLSESYYDGCMRARNLYLVKHSSICVAYVLQERSGSGQTVRLARKYGLRIINLAD